MRKQRLDTYYWLGIFVMYLQRAEPGIIVHGGSYVVESLKQLLTYFVDLELPVTRNACRRVVEFYSELRELPEDASLTDKQADELRDIITSLRQTLEAELADFEAFMPTPKNPDAKRLMEDVPGLFGLKVFKVLPKIAKYDFPEAGKCIAFERPTAAAFHLLRGTESVLRDYYDRMVPGHPTNIKNWRPIVSDLRNHTSATKYVALYNELDSMGEHYRNPTQHPEKTYDIEEAQELWSLCVAAVNRMARVLKEERK